ncbi:hypothetical protein ISF_04946 [Cordyceps fumosorosea ARSEF 2679]|uniref:Kinetochore protein fta7 n=1 Tax=Cordyceps fumosorosea (strain ARSEF 2679) TaxID=1081104 RepID=A0A167VWZ0_CORFA|nr:hypothetical protein ISF_04946 [Cordyceps fumosorosea ARSEF 2679]OAA63070.1 hypothetical protein ISF_04946 [Cordyceps fumosorosea ARSEF 2679]
MASIANLPNRKRPRPPNASVNASRRQPADDASRAAKRSRLSDSGTAVSGAALTSRSSAAALLRGPNPSVAQNRIGGQVTIPTSRQTTHPSLHDVTPSQIQNKPPPRRRSTVQGKMAARRTAGSTQAGGRSGATQRRQQQQQESSPDEQPLSRARRRVDEEQDEEEGEEAGGSETDDVDDDDDGPPSPEKPYPHVAPFTRRVRQSTIETKWSPLGHGSLKALTSILQLAQRPVLQRLSSSSNSSRAAPTEAALRLITKRILDKIRANAKQTLERQLDPVLHAVELLAAEARRAEEELEAEYEALRVLEAEARARARDSRALLKKAHVLAPDNTTTTGGGGGGEDAAAGGGGGSTVTFEKKEAAMNPFQNIEDDEVKEMVAALGAQVDRLRAGAAQTEGVGDQIPRARAALQAVLAGKLGAQTYEYVVLGR